MHIFRSISIFVICTMVLAGSFLLVVPGVVNQAQAQDDPASPVEDEDVPYGIASGWIVGHQLLREGKTADALPYLHMAYRAHPEITAIALDFQGALAAEGYLKDAIEVMSSLVEAYPDSQSYRLRRSALYLSGGQGEKALDDLREIRRMGGDSIEVISAEASILAARKKPEQALDVLREGLILHPENGAAIYLEMTRILQKSGQSEAIPGVLDQALAEYPDEPPLWMVKIRILASLGRHQDALAMAHEADAHFSAQPPPDDQSGAEMDTETAEMMPPQRGREGLPVDSFAVELADYYAQNREIDLALSVLQPLAEADELPLTPSLWLGRLLLGTGRVEEGATAIQRIVTRWPDAGRGWFLQGKVLEGSGDWDAAIGLYQRAAELAPHDPEIRLGLVRGMLVAWELDLRAAEPNDEQTERQQAFAKQTMIAATLVAEQDTEGQLMLGYAFRATGDFDRATWRFGLASENPDLRLTALVQKSICHDEIGQEGKARTDLEILREEFPDNPEVANSLGYFLAEKGQDLDLAQGLIEEALAADPGNGAFLDSMGWVLYQNENLEEALDYMIKAVNVLPEDPVILEHLGMVLKGLGQSNEALDVLKRALALGADADRIRTVIKDIESSVAE